MGRRAPHSYDVLNLYCVALQSADSHLRLLTPANCPTDGDGS